MNFQNRNKIFRIVISVGDESGIGPEIILKALNSKEIPKNILICDNFFCVKDMNRKITQKQKDEKRAQALRENLKKRKRKN